MTEPGNARKGLRLPFTLRGTPKGGYSLLLISGAFLLLGLTIVVLSLLNVRVDQRTREILGVKGALVLLCVFGLVFAFAWVIFLEGIPRLRVTSKGLVLRGCAKPHNISWDQIKGFRQSSTFLMTQDDHGTFRREEIVRPLKVVLKRGEFDLPDRYGMDTAELKDLLQRARVACVGDIGSEE